ncbi:MAG: MFS transporter [Gammaproteobacteria bacterium]|nr:MFS transporter [Gammaproteobacteria bacterium]MXW45367.1 MFS transporter [Gammaproteobacteria bacterium]MYD01914.1 MFS transporter [Gammaproteobacteria bacterium]MYI25562.1 MFS transporter [Gammaproteobacteria bacterium]
MPSGFNVAKGRELTPDPSGKRLAGLWFVPGLTATNAWSFLFVSFTTVGLLTAITGVQTNVLSENFGIPARDQGQWISGLVLWTEFVLLAVFGLVGVAADRIGRRQIFAIGLLLMGLSYVFHAYAFEIWQLFGARVLYAVGIGAATGMLATILADYPQEISRGRVVAVSGALTGLGVVLIKLMFGDGARVLVESLDLSEDSVLPLGLFLIAAVAFVTAVVAAWSLQPGTPTKREERPPVKELLTAGVREAISNPRIAVAYAGAFVARSDLVILGSFLTLWGRFAVESAGLTGPEAQAMSVRPFAVAQTAGLLWIVVLGFLLEKRDRLLALGVAFGVATIGYLGMWFVGDLLSARSIPFLALLGAGQISAFWGATTLIGREAPKASRGTVVGAFNLSGVLGILVFVALGGYMYDRYGPVAPFLMVGCANLLVMAAAGSLMLKESRAAAAARAKSAA